MREFLDPQRPFQRCGPSQVPRTTSASQEGAARYWNLRACARRPPCKVLILASKYGWGAGELLGRPLLRVSLTTGTQIFFGRFIDAGDEDRADASPDKQAVANVLSVSERVAGLATTV